MSSILQISSNKKCLHQFYSFSSIFSYSPCYLNHALFILVEDFLFRVNCISPKALAVMSSTSSQSSKIRSITESFWGSRIFIFVSEELATSFFKNNNCCFSCLGKRAHQTNNHQILWSLFFADVFCRESISFFELQ